jgi:hypothetical protein
MLRTAELVNEPPSGWHGENGTDCRHLFYGAMAGSMGVAMNTHAVILESDTSVTSCHHSTPSSAWVSTTCPKRREKDRGARENQESKPRLHDQSVDQKD